METWYVVSVSSAPENKYKLILIIDGETKRKTQNAAKKIVPGLKFGKGEDADLILTNDEYRKWLGIV